MGNDDMGSLHWLCYLNLRKDSIYLDCPSSHVAAASLAGSRFVRYWDYFALEHPLKPALLQCSDLAKSY